MAGLGLSKMPNEWWENYPKADNQDHTLGGNIPPVVPGQVAAQRELRRRWRGRTRTDQARIASQDILSAAPIVGGLIEPDYAESEEFRENHPVARWGGRTAVRAAPYLAAGAGLPGLFSTAPRAMATSGGIEALDAHMRGENPAVGAINGVVGGGIGSAVGRTLTPRNNQAAFIARREHQQHLNDGWANIQRRLRAGDITATQARQELNDLMNPIARLSDSATERIHSMARWGTLGAAGGMAAGNTGLGLILGALAPEVARAGTNATRNTINRALNTNSGSQFINAHREWLNNNFLSDRSRSILHALSTPAVSEMERAGRSIPTLMEE